MCIFIKTHLTDALECIICDVLLGSSRVFGHSISDSLYQGDPIGINHFPTATIHELTLLSKATLWLFLQSL